MRVRSNGRRFNLQFLIDTGADFSVAPRRLAHVIGLDWLVLPEVGVVGVERGGVRARLGPLQLRLGAVNVLVRCLFMDSPQTPLILGRADFLDRFVPTIDTRQALITLDEIA